mmetsp:Transcript_16179/g.27878  ORF Transcript_16179/g.27878 Transcript_16179/m.27878 type:complete len:231 (-) Transcript_16179:78-770(-)
MVVAAKFTMLQSPGALHHLAEIVIVVDGSAHSRVVIQKLIPRHHSIWISGRIKRIQKMPEALVLRPFAAQKLGMLTCVIQLPDVLDCDLSVVRGVHLLEGLAYVLLTVRVYWTPDGHQKLVKAQFSAAVFVQLSEHFGYRLVVKFPKTVVTETITEFTQIQRLASIVIHSPKTSSQSFNSVSPALETGIAKFLNWRGGSSIAIFCQLFQMGLFVCCARHFVLSRRNSRNS